jgi:hypothetical protein
VPKQSIPIYRRWGTRRPAKDALAESSPGEKIVKRSGTRGAVVAAAKRAMSSSPNGTGFADTRHCDMRTVDLLLEQINYGNPVSHDILDSLSLLQIISLEL